MSCCGDKRREAAMPQSGEGAAAVAAPASEWSVVYLEYTGETGLSVRGPFTGRGYRFEETGSRAAVDSRDAPALLAFPRLQRVLTSRRAVAH